MAPGSSDVPWSPDVPQTRCMEGVRMQPPGLVPPGDVVWLVSAIAVIWRSLVYVVARIRK